MSGVPPGYYSQASAPNLHYASGGYTGYAPSAPGTAYGQQPYSSTAHSGSFSGPMYGGGAAPPPMTHHASGPLPHAHQPYGYGGGHAPAAYGQPGMPQRGSSMPTLGYGHQQSSMGYVPPMPQVPGMAPIQMPPLPYGASQQYASYSGTPSPQPQGAPKEKRKKASKRASAPPPAVPDEPSETELERARRLIAEREEADKNQRTSAVTTEKSTQAELEAAKKNFSKATSGGVTSDPARDFNATVGDISVSGSMSIVSHGGGSAQTARTSKKTKEMKYIGQRKKKGAVRRAIFGSGNSRRRKHYDGVTRFT